MDLKLRARYDLNVSDSELRLIAKGLALLAGVKVSTDGGERLEASALNLRMLDQQHKHYLEQVAVAHAALKNAEETLTAAASRAPVIPMETATQLQERQKP